VDCSYSNLKQIPKRILTNQSLRDLNLSGNSITQLPSPLARDLPALESLDLSGNQLKGLPRAFAAWDLPRSLVRLNLNHNSLVIFPIQVTLLTNLQALDLSSNRLPTLPPGIGKLVNLVHLRVTDNMLESIADGAIYYVDG
jgi:hypothetical protein